jgi:signal peptidase I
MMAGNYWKIRKRRKGLKEIIKHLKHILHVNDDILTGNAKEKVREIVAEAEKIDPVDFEKADPFIDKAPLRAAKILPKRSYPTMREYADIVAVAFMVAFGIRALFFQPFKIPTSSMQPTLFGIHYIEGADSLPDLTRYGTLLLFDAERAKAVAKNDGAVIPGSFNNFQRDLFYPQTAFQVGLEDEDMPGKYKYVDNYVLPGETSKVQQYCHMSQKWDYKKGDSICDGWLSQGDHLFVDRYTHHFFDLKRGDIIVFNTEGIFYDGRRIADNAYYYIKRLIGLPGDTIKIIDSMVYIKPKGEDKFRPIVEFSDKFKKLYSGKGGYHGHLASGLLQPGNQVEVPEGHFFAMGDNSANSLDGRSWGFVPRENIVGTPLLVFWPLSRRWGLVDRKDPLDVETQAGLPSMNMQ